MYGMLSILKRSPAVALTATFALAAALWSQTPVPADVPVTLDPSGSQTLAAAVVDMNDRFLAAWKDSSSAGAHILLQAFDRKGGRVGDTLTASVFAVTRKSGPSLAVDNSGRAVVAWADGIWPSSRVYFRRFSTSGAALDSALKPNEGTRVIRGRTVSVASDSVGNTLLVWEDQTEDGFDIFASRFAFSDALGQGAVDTTVHHWVGNHQLNFSRRGDQVDPALAADRKGNAVVAWRDLDPDSSGLRVAAYDSRGRLLFQRLALPADSSKVAGVFPPAVTRSYRSSSISEFHVSWVESDTSGMRRLKLLKLGIRTNILPQSVIVDSAAFDVPSGSGLPTGKPSISGNERGDVTLLWNESEAGGSVTVRYFSFDHGDGLDGASTGVLPLEKPFPFRPVTAVRPSGYFYGLWEDSSNGLPDIWMQNFSPAGVIDDPMHISPGGSHEQVGTVALAGHPDRSYSLFWERRSDELTRIERLDFDANDRPRGATRPLLEDARSQRAPVSAADQSGRYIVAWQEAGPQDYRVRVSLFGPDGNPVKEGLVLQQSSQTFLGGMTAALDMDGFSYLAWERWAPLAKAPDLVLARLDSLGNPLGVQRTVASAAQGGGRYASLAAGPESRHMILWRQGTVQGVNAFIKARVFGPDGTPVGQDIRVSAEMEEFVGSSGRPVAAASPVTGNFMVVWQEFFSDRQRLYYRLYSSLGDSLELPAGMGFRGDVDNGSSLGEISQTSPALAVDPLGDYLILWVEKQAGAGARLLGRKIDSLGLPKGAVFRVPGVEMATLPVVGILGPNRVALAWVDTVGGNSRLLVQSLQINFTSLSGRIDLARVARPDPLFVHIEGNVTDSAAVDAEGGFEFHTLTDGSYRLRATSGGRELLLGRDGFSLSGGGRVDLGRIEVLDSPGPDLPRAGGLALSQNVPNPFNPSTTIAFELPEDGTARRVSIRVYDIRGALVRVLLEDDLTGGRRSVQWDGRDTKGREVPSGVYFYRLSHGDRSLVRKMILLK